MQKTRQIFDSRFLFATQLSSLYIINRNYCKISFYPSGLSVDFWVYPDHLRDDELFMEQYLWASDTFIDAGANVGAATLIHAVLVGESGKLFSFEPHPRIYKYLISNIKLNSINNFHALIMCTRIY